MQILTGHRRQNGQSLMGSLELKRHSDTCAYRIAILVVARHQGLTNMHLFSNFEECFIRKMFNNNASHPS